MIRKALVKRGGQVIEVMVDDNTFKKGGSNMIKRKDGSYSQRGLWDNIRANKGSGKKPTKQMLEQEKKIRNKKQTGGEETYGNYMLPEFEITENTGMYNPNIAGPSAPRYIPSETGFVPNPYYTTGSGSAESIPLEMFAAPMMRGASSLIGMLSPNAMKTILGVGAASSLGGCAPGKDCKGLDALPGRTKYKTSKRKKRRRQEGGEEDFYTPDTGIEQFAPDQSWYEGNPNASAPGNVVSWPSYPKGTGIPMSELPAEAMPQRIPPSQDSLSFGTGRYPTRPSNSITSLNNDYRRYKINIPEDRRSFDLFNRMGQGFNNMGEAMGDGFDNLGDFFQRMKKNRKKARRDRRRGRRGNGLLNLLRGKKGNGLLNCESGTRCAQFQEGGEESDQMEEILDQIEDALEQNAKPEEILLQLTEMGIDEQQAQMLIEEAKQDLLEDATENELPEAQFGGDGKNGIQKMSADATRTDLKPMPKGPFKKIKEDPQYAAPQYISIVDDRKVRATTGKPLVPTRDLKSGKYETRNLVDLITAARDRGLSIEDAYNLGAMAFQETYWGRTDPNIGHVLMKKEDWSEDLNYEQLMIDAYLQSQKKAKELGYTDPRYKFQVYNGLGTLYPSTEAGYHGGNSKAFYGVPIPKEGLDMKKNPLYGIEVMDTDKLLRKNTDYNAIINSIYKDIEQLQQQKKGGQLLKAANGMQTPFINNGGDDEEIQKKLAKVKRPEDLFASDLNKANEFRQESEKYFTDWISDPITKERLKDYHQKIDFIDRAVGDIKGQTTKEVKENLKDKYINDIVSQSIKNLSKGNILYNPDPTVNKFLEEKYYSLLPEEDRKRAIKNAQQNPQGFTDSYGNVVITNAANDPNIGPYAGQGAINVYLHELGHLPLFGDGESYGELLKGKFKPSEDPELAKNFSYKDREEFWPALMQYRKANKLVPGQIVSPEDVKRFIGSGGRNLLFKYYTPQEVSKYLNTVAYNKQNNSINKQNNSMGLDMPMGKDGGSYRVYRTSERKGKTHKVVGPGGVTKYFGDPKLGERSKSKYGKKAFYARHKKNLANNPFFRAYARATWAEGGEPTFMNKPEFKSSSFIEKVKQLGQQNLEKNLFEQFEEEQNQMMMAAGGYMDDPSYIKNPQIDMFNQARQKLGNPIGDALKAFNDWGLKTEKKIEQAATALGMAFGVPGAGKMVKAGFDMARPKTGNENQTASAGTSGSGGMGNMLNSIMGSTGGSGGAGAEGAAGGMDISQLASLFGAKYGGNLPRYDIAGQTSVPGFTSDMIVDPWSNWGLNQNNIALPQQPQQYITADQSLNTPALTATPDNLGVWSDDMKTYTPASFGPKNQMNQPGVSTEGTNPNKDPLLKPAVQKPKTPDFTNQIVTTGLPLGVALLGAMGRERKFDKLNAQSSNLTLADNSFLATEQPNRGDYTLNEGFFRPDEQGMPGANYAIPRLSAARYGGNLRRAQNGLENVISFAGDRYVENYLPAGNNQKPLTNEYFRNINYYSDMPSDTTYGFVSAPGGNQYIINSRLTPQSERDLSKEEMIKRKLKVKKHGGVQKDGMYLSYPTATPESVVYGEQPKKISNTLSPIKREFANLEAEGGETVMTPAGIDGLPKFFKIRGKRHSEGGAPLNLPDNSFIFSDTRSMKFSKDILEEFGIKGKNKKTPAEISGLLGKGYAQYIEIIQDPNSDSIERKTAEMMIRNQINLLGKLAVAQESKKGFPQGIPMIAIPYLESMGISPEELLPQIPNQQNNMEELGNQQQMPEMSMQQIPMARYGMQKYQSGKEKQTNPFWTSSASTPDNPNVAQRILGPLFNQAAGLPEPIAGERSPIYIPSFPTQLKGFGPNNAENQRGSEALSKFISTSNELTNNDFTPVIKEYYGRLEAIDLLKDALVNKRISLDQYNTQKEQIVKEIDDLQTWMSSYDIPGSWAGNPWGVQNKLEDLGSILSEQKTMLGDVETYRTNMDQYESKINDLNTEKNNIKKLLKDPNTPPINKFKFKEDLNKIDKAIAFESYNAENYNNSFRGIKQYAYSTKLDDLTYYDPETGMPYRPNAPERYSYDDYFKEKISANAQVPEQPITDANDPSNLDLSLPTIADSSATKDSSGVNTPTDSSRVVEPTSVKQKQSSNRNQIVNKSKIRTKTKLKFATGATEE